MQMPRKYVICSNSSPVCCIVGKVTQSCVEFSGDGKQNPVTHAGLKLRRLNLGGNELSAVPTEALSIMDTLKKLEMQENHITDIHEGDFEELASRVFLSVTLAEHQMDSHSGPNVKLI
ncbi:unnamed protein product [Timema podura]|uniref:Uncharacterized protein n=1 Tax=Timema podura TaxID=61482 RepID=A0ABN7NBU7_TIMPD|nr:unnamed protein product [Timema podura]